MIGDVGDGHGVAVAPVVSSAARRCGLRGRVPLGLASSAGAIGVLFVLLWRFVFRKRYEGPWWNLDEDVYGSSVLSARRRP